MPMETEAQVLLAETQDSQVRERHWPSSGWSAKRVAGLLVGGVGACAVGLGFATWSAPKALTVGGEVDGLIQEDSWANCDVDWVIKRRVRDNLGGHLKHTPKGMQFEVERHGGGLPTQLFLLDVKAPKIRGGDRSGDGKAIGSLWKLHLAHGHPLNIHFSLWDLEHKHKLTMQNFGIGFYDLDESKKGGHHEYIIADPSMVARVGPGLEVDALKSGKMKFQATKFGLGEDDPAKNTELTDVQESKHVRLVYSNVKEFTVSFGWTNPNHGIPREISFDTHDPAHCTNPLQATPAPAPPVDEAAAEAEEEAKDEAEEAAEAAKDEAEEAQEAQDEAEEEAEAAKDKADHAEAAQKKAERAAESAKHREQEAQAAKEKAEHAAHVAQNKADNKVDAAEEKAEKAQEAQQKAQDALEEKEEKAENKLDAAQKKVDAAKEQQGQAEHDAEAAQQQASKAADAQGDAERKAANERAALGRAQDAQAKAEAEAAAAKHDMLAAEAAMTRARAQVDEAQDSVGTAEAKAEAAQKTADCEEKKAEANEELGDKQAAVLEHVEQELQEALDEKPAPCPDCE